MSVIGGLGIHRKQLTFDCLDTATGQVTRGQVSPADREHLRGWLGRFAGRGDVAFAFEGCTGWRYVAEELAYVLVDAGTRALVFHSCFARQVEHVRDLVPTLDVLVQVPDDSGADLLPGAVWWADALATPADGELPEPTGDDLYVVYTGGTTGMPKGVLWRQDDMYVTSMGGTPFGTTEPYESYEAIAENARAANGGMTLLMALPFMHGAAQWSTFHMITSGGKIVLPDDVRSFDADAVLRTVVREGCVSLPVVGDAMVRPIIAALETGDHDLSGLAAVNNGAAPLSPAVRARLMELLPHILVMDAANAFETQDLQLADLVEREGRGLIFCISKWDLVDNPAERLAELKETAERMLPQVRGTQLIALSAETGRGVERLMPAVFGMHRNWSTKVKTRDLNDWLQMAIQRHPPPAVAGRRIKPKYMAQTKARPPTFVLFASRADENKSES